MPSDNTFTCEVCGGTFENEDGWGEADAKAEYLRDFSDVDPEGKEMGVCCDDCYQRVTAWMKTEGLHRDSPRTN